MPDQGVVTTEAVCPVCHQQVADDGRGHSAEHRDLRGMRCRGSGWHRVKRVAIVGRTVLEEKSNGRR